MTPTPLPAVPSALANQGLSLRPCDEADAEFLRDVYVSVRWEETAATGWPEPLRLAFLHDQYRLQTAHYDAHYQGAAWGVVEVAGERAGRLYLLHRGDDLRVVDIAFLPAFRGRGFGGALLAAAGELAQSLGAAKVSIHVEESNPARRLYQRLGFREAEVRGLYILMERPIN